MKFISYLTEATLLKRNLGFLAEIALQNKRRLMIRCPNLGQMVGCDILGTKIWYSNASGFNCLPTWELAEVDHGHLVCVNTEIIKSVFNEALKIGVIKELSGYKHMQSLSSYEIIDGPLIMLEKNDLPCCVGVEHVTLADEKGNAFFPDAKGVGLKMLDRLIDVKKDGCRAILFYAVMHTGASCVKPALHIDMRYKEKLLQAKEAGIEIVAYKSVISLNSIELVLPLPVLSSENLTSSFR